MAALASLGRPASGGHAGRTRAPCSPLHLATWTSEVSPDGAPDAAAAFLDEGTDLADVRVLDDDRPTVGYVRLGGPEGRPARPRPQSDRARRLYEACGFVVEGVLREEFLLDGRYADDLFLAHHLVERALLAPAQRPQHRRGGGPLAPVAQDRVADGLRPRPPQRSRPGSGGARAAARSPASTSSS